MATTTQHMLVLGFSCSIDPLLSCAAGPQRRLVIEAKQITRLDRTQKRHKRIRNKVSGMFSPAIP